jgi:predicted Zn-dependent protease
VPVETRQPPVVDERVPVAAPKTVEPFPPKAAAPGVVEPAPSDTQPPIRKPTPAAPPAASPAVVALLEEARQQAAAGDGEGAAASLERALRIEPKNPWLWHRLGVLRLQQGRPEEAMELAKKSNTLAAGNLYLLAGNWELIAQARQALGDAAGAVQARETARRYRALAGGEPT